MNDNYEAIIAGEIPVLEQEILNSPLRLEAALERKGPFRRVAAKRKEAQYLTALKFCLEYCREELYLTKYFTDLFDYLRKHFAIEANLFLKTKGEPVPEERWLRDQWGTSAAIEIAKQRFGQLIDDPIGPHFPEVVNIVFYRRTIMLQKLLEQFKVILAESPDIIRNGNDGLKQALWRMGDQCLEERRHRHPLNLLAAKNVQIEGDIYGEAMTFLREVASGKDERPTKQNSDTIVDQAFERIVQVISNQKEANRRIEDLAEKCRALKIAFPEAQAQIDKLFRQEVDNLKR